jgi:hypothetical protein
MLDGKLLDADALRGAAGDTGRPQYRPRRCVKNSPGVKIA